MINDEKLSGLVTGKIEYLVTIIESGNIEKEIDRYLISCNDSVDFEANITKLRSYIENNYGDDFIVRIVQYNRKEFTIMVEVWKYNIY